MTAIKREVTLSPEDARAIARYEKTFMDYCENPDDELRVSFSERYPISLEDLFEAIANIRKKNPTVGEFGENWFYPIESLAEDFCLEEAAGLSGENGSDWQDVRGLMSTDEEMFADTWFRMSAIWHQMDDASRMLDIPEFAEMESSLHDYMVLREVPVLDRVFSPDVMEEYIARFLSDTYRKGANETEILLARKFTDQLCEMDSVPALRLKGYSHYGGNELYGCDWAESERCISRLLTLTGNPEYANTLGYIAYYGRTGEPDYDKAFRYYSLAAACGFYEASYKLADMYRSGQGCIKSDTAARELYSRVYADCRRCLEQDGSSVNLADAALRMSYVFRDGIDTFPDMTEAYRFALEAVHFAALRARENDFFGNTEVLLTAARVRDGIRKRLPRDYHEETFFSEAPVLIDLLLSGRHTAEIRCTSDAKNNVRMHLSRVSGIPGKKPDGFLLTIPQMDVCDVVTGIDLTLEDVNGTVPSGKKIIDCVRFERHTQTTVFLCLGKEILTLRCGGYRFSGTGSSEDQEPRMTFVTVPAGNGEKPGDYLCTDPGIREGDTVTVNTENGERETTVSAVFSVPSEEFGISEERFPKAIRTKKS